MANTLAYYDTATITAIKSFIVQTRVNKSLIIEAREFVPGKPLETCLMFASEVPRMKHLSGATL